MKKLSAFLLLVVCTLSLMAAPVKQKDAAQVARNFWTSVSSQPIQEMTIVPQTGFSQFYIFDINKGGGFVIVSADDAAYPILGYSTNTPAGDLGPETRFWLGQYENEIEALAAGSVEVETELQNYISGQWGALLQGVPPQPKNNFVPQMLTTQWNQSPYYNALCPAGTPVGCVATATAQVMKYWNHPVVGNGSHSYNEDDYGTLSADFGNTTYDWDNMPNRLTSRSTTAQVTAVATLSYHIGVAIEMDYSPDGSGAQVLGYGASSQNALVNYFNYENTLSGIMKSNYTDAEWVETLKDELDEGRPILYAGYDNSAGHAFVFDGYDVNSQFHVNWGWGGSYDGYFVMGALNPAGGGVGTNTSNTFNYYNQALIGIQPKPTLAALPSSLLYDINGGTVSLEVHSDYGDSTSWTATTDAPWLTLSSSTGQGSGATSIIQVSAAATTSGHPRHATITFVQSSNSIQVPVYQHDCQNSDMCELTVNMTARSGNSWDGAYLSFESTDGIVYGTATVPSGIYATKTIQVCPDTVLVHWHPSSLVSNDAQCAYFIDNSQGIMWLNHEDGDAFSSTPDTIVSPCADTGGTPTYTCTLELESNDSTFGEVFGADSNIHFGEYRTIQAMAKPGYRFTRWSDYVSDNPRQVLLIRDRSITARFENLGSDTLHYDNGSYSTAVNGESNFAWGIRFGLDQLVGHRQLEGVKFYCASTGRYTVTIYQNASNTPLVQVHQQTVNLNYRNMGRWYEMTFDTPVDINHTRPLWIVIQSRNASAPAAMTAWCGNNEGSWYTEDGTNWSSITQMDTPIYGTWMVRAVMPLDRTDYTLRVTSTRPTWGSVTGGGLYKYGQNVSIEAHPQEGYHFVRWSDQNTENPRLVTVTSDSVIRAVFGEGEVGVDDLEAEGISIAVEGHNLLVDGAVGRSLRVYDVMGRCVYSAARFDGTPVRLTAVGVYMVKVEGLQPRRVVLAAQF